MKKLIICWLSVMLASLVYYYKEWIEEHHMSIELVFALLTVAWMALLVFIWHELGFAYL